MPNELRFTAVGNLNERGSYPNPIIYALLRAVALATSKIAWRLRFQGAENIPVGDGAFIISGNHQTYIDPVWIAIPIKKKIRFLAWDKAFTWPVVGRLVRYLGSVPVDTRSGRNTDAWRSAREALKKGNAVMIFPEGEREFADGKLLPFKPGAIRLALEADVPILPVTVKGANKVWPQGMKYPRPGRVEIIFHPVMRFERVAPGADRQEHVRRCEVWLKEVIASAMD